MPAMPLTLILLVRYLFCWTCRNYVSNSLRCCLAPGWCDWLPLLARMPEGRDCTSTPCSPQAALSDETGRNRDETAWQACETDETSKLKEILVLSSYQWFRRFHTPAVRFRRGFVAVSSGFVVLGALGPQWVPVESSVRRLPHNWWRRGRLQGIPQVVVKPRRHTSTPASLLLSTCIYIYIYIYNVYIVFAE